VSPKRYYTLMMEPELIEALKAAAAKQPEVSEAAIVRTALREWLAKGGVKVPLVKKKSERPRPASRKRS
jgi:hypothetical protein